MEKREKKYRFSEIFGNTVQGEGHYTGVPTVWVRWWGCNKECLGFGQKDPTNPSTYVLPFQTFNIENIKRVEDLPVWHTGCDSSYSWSKKFQHLAGLESASVICDRLEAIMKNEFNPDGSFIHPRSGQVTHLAFTGGEPMMSQHGIIAVLNEFKERENWPDYVTVETNGTMSVRRDLASILQADYARKGTEWFWSVSPKLSASGETWESSIMPEVLEEYTELSNHGQLKYVVDGSQRCWDEVDAATEEYRDVGVDWPVWIMPVGADLEMQAEHAAKIAEDSIARGFNVAARVHVYLFGNAIGK